MSGPLGDFSFALPRRHALVMATGRLETLKALLPEDEVLESKYVAELHAIVDFIESGADLNLDRYRMTTRSRSELRINVLALLSVCEYQSRPPAADHWSNIPFSSMPGRTSRKVH